MAAQVSFEEGLTEERITGETVRATLARMGVRWERAKRWITSPDPEQARKKASFASDRLIGLAEGRPEQVVGFLEETWWSSLARPTRNSWSETGEPLRLIEQSVAKDDPSEATKTISCYGLYVPGLEKVWLRFVDGRPVSSITTRFLSWCCQKLQAAGKKVWVLIWVDRLSQPRSQKRWRRSEDREPPLAQEEPVAQLYGAQRVHAKRKVVEPHGLLTAYELAERVCGVFDCPHYEHLSIAENAA